MGIVLKLSRPGIGVKNEASNDRDNQNTAEKTNAELQIKKKQSHTQNARAALEALYEAEMRWNRRAWRMRRRGLDMGSGKK